MKNLLKLEGLGLDNCRKLVSLPELPPTLERFSVINCTSLQQIDFTQLLLLVNINVCYVILPGDQVPDMFRFHAEGDSITLPHLPHSCRISGFICCFILSHLPPDGICGRLFCYINKLSTPIQPSGGYWFASHGSMADHVLLCFLDKKKILQGWACDSNSMRFEFYFMKGEKIKIEIKRCGVVPVYSSQDLDPTILTVSTEHELKTKAPGFMTEENWYYYSEKQIIIPFYTPSANMKAILEKLETLLETSLEIISSNDEVKRQFHIVLELLGRFEDEVPVRLHPIICKVKTLIKGFDFRFATAQKTIQDYDQLLQSRFLISKQLKSVKVQKVLCAFSILLGFSKIKNLIKTKASYLKNSEAAYKVAVTNKKKYEDEWAQLKNNFAANKY